MANPDDGYLSFIIYQSYSFKYENKILMNKNLVHNVLDMRL